MSCLAEAPVTRSIRSVGAIIFVTAIVFACVSSSSAQSSGGIDQTGTGGRHSIVGRIYFPSGRRSDIRVKVRLQSYGGGELSVLSDMNGSFKFSGLIPGNYVVIIDGSDDYEAAEETVYIESDGNSARNGLRLPVMPRSYNVQVSLRPKKGNTAKAAVVNAGLANVPDDAVKLYEQAIHLSEEKQTAKAVETLQQALAIYPNFALALNELGVQYLTLGQVKKAIEPLQSATKLTPGAFTPNLNLGIALLENRQFTEAEGQLRETLKISSTPKLHYYLGLSLIPLRQDAQAVDEFKTTITTGGDQFPKAHYYLGGLYWRTGERRRAADELETYLRIAPNDPEAPKLRATIGELRAR